MRAPILTALLLLFATSAAAQDQTGPFTWSGEIGALSDYRSYGVSMSDNDPALQGGVWVAHESGLNGGLWGSLAHRGFGDRELDLTFGYAFDIGQAKAELTLTRYMWPNQDDVDYTSLIAAYNRDIGGWSTRTMIEYVPDQTNLSDDGVYLALETERPIGDTGLTFIGNVGWEKGVFTLDGEKWDYQIGVRYDFDRVALGLSLVGTDEDAPIGEEDLYEGGPVVSITSAF
jgi:uncharacterized protein (TIGR02001 family)